jgi:hypothetical protein
VKRLKLGFSDSGPGLDGPFALFAELLGQSFAVEVVKNNRDADTLIYSDHGTAHQQFKGRKIYYTFENMLPDYEECDFAITSCVRPEDPRHYRLPFYALTSDPGKLIKGPDFQAETVLREKTGFCCFVVTNPRSPERNRFFKMLNARKRVDSGGRHFNNIGGKIGDKQAFVDRYKFAITFENTMSPGYTTEKITDAMMAQTLPIYWGNPEVGSEFNTRSFINASDFPNQEALCDHVLRVEADDELYLKYMREPWFVGNVAPAVFRRDLLQQALARFVESEFQPRARVYKKRRLRQHIYSSPWEQTVISLKCRVESKLWQIGIRG